MNEAELAPRQMERIYRELTKKPDDYTIYKGGGAISVSLKAGVPWDMEGGKSFLGTKKGCIFITGAPATGKRAYDWKDGRITLALSEHEVGRLILTLQKRQKAEFFHDKDLGKETQGEKTKKLQIAPTDDGTALMFRFVERVKGEDRALKSIPVLAEEAITLCTLLRAAIPKILGW